MSTRVSACSTRNSCFIRHASPKNKRLLWASTSGSPLVQATQLVLHRSQASVGRRGKQEPGSLSKPTCSLWEVRKVSFWPRHVPESLRDRETPLSIALSFNDLRCRRERLFAPGTPCIGTKCDPALLGLDSVAYRCSHRFYVTTAGVRTRIFRRAATVTP